MVAKVVTVFGGSGFVGRQVVRELARIGCRVRVAVRFPDTASDLKPMGDVGQIVPIACNIRQDSSVARALDGADAVINLVGILYESGTQTFDAVHHQGSARIAKAAKAAGITSFIQMSALGAAPDSPALYARSKAAGEAAVRAEIPEAIVVRPSIIFGPEDSFFNRFHCIIVVINSWCNNIQHIDFIQQIFEILKIFIRQWII